MQVDSDNENEYIETYSDNDNDNISKTKEDVEILIRENKAIFKEMKNSKYAAHFYRIEINKDLLSNFACCKHCRALIPITSRNTKSLVLHLNNNHKSLLPDQKPFDKNISIEYFFKRKSTAKEKDLIKSLITEMITKCYLSFTLISSQPFINYSYYLISLNNIDTSTENLIPSESTIRKYFLENYYARTKQKIINELQFIEYAA